MNPNAWPWLWIFFGIAAFAACGLLLRVVREDTDEEAELRRIMEELDNRAFLTSVYGVELDDEPATVKESLLVGVAKESSGAFTLRPNWDEAPEWARWAAQDEDGHIEWFERKPLWKDDIGYSPSWFRPTKDVVDKARRVWAGNGPANPNWRQAIEQRPVKVGAATPINWEAHVRYDHGTEILSGTYSPASTPERDENDLIPRARHRQLIAIEAAAEKYVKGRQGQKAFEALAKAVRVTL